MVAAMRRYLAGLAGLALLILLVGCGGGGSQANPELVVRVGVG